MCVSVNSDTPVAVGLRLLLSQSLEDGHRNPENRNPSKWNGKCVDDVLNVKLVGVSIENIDGNLQ